MPKVYGGFSLPQSNQSTITRFSSIREYVLDANTLHGISQVNITDVGANSVIYRIDLIVMNGFSDASGKQHDLEVTDHNDNVLMAIEWNDPNERGTYCSNCYCTVLPEAETIKVKHTMGEMLSGLAILRLYIYNNVVDYSNLLTADNEIYQTMDQNSIEIVRNI